MFIGFFLNFRSFYVLQERAFTVRLNGSSGIATMDDRRQYGRWVFSSTTWCAEISHSKKTSKSSKPKFSSRAD